MVKPWSKPHIRLHFDPLCAKSNPDPGIAWYATVSLVKNDANWYCFYTRGDDPLMKSVSDAWPIVIPLLNSMY